MMKKFTENFRSRVGIKNYFRFMLILMVCFTAMNVFGQTTWTDKTYNHDVANIELNPMKGLMPGYGINTTVMPYSTDHFYIRLKDINTARGVYDWTLFESNLNSKGTGGRHVVGRVWCFYPGSATGVPQYLINEGVKMYGECPDWNDSKLNLALKDFIAAFGARYDGDPRIVLIEAGLYGSWGEWNIVNSPTGVTAMSQTNMDNLLIAYDNAFNTTHIALRYGDKASTETLARTVGYYDDSFCYETLYTSWCFWPKIVTKGISDIWKTHPIAGEMRPEVQQYIFDSWPNPTSAGGYSIEDITNCVNTTHASFVKAYYLWSTTPTATELTNAKRMTKMMGYEFFVRSVKLTPNTDKTVNVEVNIQNKGVAPIYYNWVVEIGAKNTSTGAFTSIKTTNWNITGVLPSAVDYYKSVTTNALADGDYKILMRFVNPLEAIKGTAMVLRFANTTQDTDRNGWLTLGTATIVTPILPTSVSVSPTTLTLTAIGNTGQLTPTVLPTNTTNTTVTWSSNATSIATVNSSGLVTAVAAGNATITATTVNGLTATSAVSVTTGSINAFSQIEAENYTSMSGVQAEACTEGGQNIGWIENGDYIVFNNVNFGTGAGSFDARVASGAAGGSIEVRLGSITGTLVGTCAVTATGGWQTWVTKSCAISGASGTQNLYLKFTGGTGYLFNLNWFKFTATSLPNVAALTGWVTGTTNAKVAGSNRLMTVMVMGESNVNFSATGVTYGGQAMTKQTEKMYYVAGNRTYASIFTLIETGVNAATNGTIAVNWSPTPSVGSSIYSVLLGNVDQTTPVGVTANNGLTGTTVTTTALSAASGDMVITAGATENDGSITFNNGFTEAFETSGLAWGDACGGYKMGSGTNETPSFTQSASMRLALCAIVAKKSLSGLKSASIVSSAGIDNSAGNIVNVYPNPVSNTLYINHADAQSMINIKIFNLQGQMLYNKQTSGSMTLVDVKDFKITGLIIVQVSSGNDISTFKVSVVN